MGKRRHDLGQKIRRDGRDHAKAHPAAGRPLRGAHEIVDLVDGEQDLAPPPQQLLTGRGQPHRAAPALDQRRAEHRLQFLDLHGQGRLADPAKLGRPAKVPLSREGVEISKMFEGETNHKLSLSQK